MISLNGDINTGILIRTTYLRDGMARYPVGATLLYDSVPAMEELETRLKATGFTRLNNRNDLSLPKISSGVAQMQRWATLCRDARPLEAARRVRRRIVQIAGGARSRDGISPPATACAEAVRCAYRKSDPGWHRRSNAVALPG